HEWNLSQAEEAEISSPEQSVQPQEPPKGARQTAQTTDAEPGKSTAEIQAWLVTHIAKELKVNSREIDIHTPFAQYGMDSVQAVSMAADLEDWLGRELPATLVYDYPTIEGLARHLSEETANTQATSSQLNAK